MPRLVEIGIDCILALVNFVQEKKIVTVIDCCNFVGMTI